MKKQNEKRWMMAIVVVCMAVLVNSCGLDGYEMEKPFTTCPTERGLVAYTTNEKGQDVILFSDKDIVWFDVDTRELRLKETEGEPIYKRLNPFHPIEFRTNNNKVVLEVSSFVGAWDSRVFDNLVLIYGKVNDDGTIDEHYYLCDCYPQQLASDERVKANIQKNAAQWKAFVDYLQIQGKILMK